MNHRAALAAAAALLLTTAACGDGGSTPDESGGKTPPGTVAVADFAFTPKTITIEAGGDVTWRNADDFDHTVKADDGSFDSAEIKPGTTFKRTFPAAGTFTYFCNIHNSMTGSVVVE